MSIALGAIADDFTGATDLCNTLVKEGMSAVQVIGVPDGSIDLGGADAVVVALKSRTAPADEAVSMSLAAHDWLKANGAGRIIEKYCSTFDSTASGNIGPITDALLDRSGAAAAVICPAFPENGRTVYQGHLFVHGDPLSESSMKDHPLTPMRDSSLVRLMEAQSRGRAAVVPLETIRLGSEAIRAAIATLIGEGASHIVTDATERSDLVAVASAIPDDMLITGGSGIALGLPESLRKSGRIGWSPAPRPPRVEGRKLILAGSCSTATLGQIARAGSRWPTRRLRLDDIAAGDAAIADLADWADGQPADQPVLIHASAGPDEVRAAQRRYGVQGAGAMVERALGALAATLADAGHRKMIVAGGETSGALVSALGVRALRIGPEFAPGVPWTGTVGGTPMALALKSGNFGSETFFEDAFGMLP